MIKRLELRAQRAFLRVLPAAWRSALESRGGFSSVFASILHLLGEKGLRLSLGLFTYPLVVRHLGPEEYGHYSYILNFLTIFVPIVQYGLDEIVSRDFVLNRDDAKKTGEIFLTVLVVKLVNATIGVGAYLMIYRILRPEETSTLLILSLYGVAYLLRALEVFDLLYQSRMYVRRLTWSRNGAYVLSSLLKLWGIKAGFGYVYYVALSGVEYAVARLLIAISYFRETAELKLSFSKKYAAKIWGQAFPQFLSLFMIAFNDRVMTLLVEHFLKKSDVGLYNAATGLLDIWLFFPIAICASVYPALVKAKKHDEKMYQHRAETLVRLLVWMAIVMAIGLTVIGKPAVNFLFGDRYSGVFSLLRIAAWSQVFVYFNWFRLKWFALEDAMAQLMGIVLISICVQISVAFTLVPKLGVVGAGWSLFVGHLSGLLIGAAVFPKGRESAKILMHALIDPTARRKRRRA